MFTIQLRISYLRKSVRLLCSILRVSQQWHGKLDSSLTNKRPSEVSQRWVRRAIAGVVVASVITSCALSPPEQATDWQTYHNARYHFEFLYPANWLPITAADPASHAFTDGQAYRDPTNANVEIRGWASQILIFDPNGKPSVPITTGYEPNFVTEQGRSGQLDVDIGLEESRMRLTIVGGDLVYYWQGRSPSPQFAEYYPFFDSVARQYRIDPDATVAPAPTPDTTAGTP